MQYQHRAPEREEILRRDLYQAYSLLTCRRMFDGKWFACVEVRPPVWNHRAPMLLCMWPEEPSLVVTGFTDPVAGLECLTLARRQVDSVLKTGTPDIPTTGQGIVIDNRGPAPWKRN
jgi:hypothetical protein